MVVTKMKVYVVTVNDEENQGVDKIFTTKEAAESYWQKGRKKTEAKILAYYKQHGVIFGLRYGSKIEEIEVEEENK